MFGLYVADQVAAVIQEHGETMVLKRAGQTPITLKGKRIPGTTEAVGGTAVQQRFRVKIGVTELDASPWASKQPSARTDTINVGGVERAILDVRPLGDGGVIALFELEVEG